MMPVAQMDTEQIRQFVYQRVSNDARFRTVIDVSVEKYPSEYSAIIWVGEPTSAMRQAAYQIEDELATLGAMSNVIVKSDRELSLGEVCMLQTKRGTFGYRYYSLEPLRDEEKVFGFAVYEGDRVFRFRFSLTGTLASLLRTRNTLGEERTLEVYRDWIRERLETGDVSADGLNEKMFNSQDLQLFAAR